MHPQMIASNLLGAALALCMLGTASAECGTRSSTSAAHVVELYTSEGCSSCPPAENWLRKLSAANADIVALEFHVDYWDSLGWRDRFSDPRYTDRQQQIAAHSQNSIVYTPEVIVDGREWRNWSARDLPESRARAIPVELQATPGRPLRARIDVGSAERADSLRWYLAVTEAGLKSTVTAGENRGTTLPHAQVVRALSGPLAVTDEAVLSDLPADIDYAHASLVALVVDALTSDTVAATSASLAGCADLHR
jgi:hypothetical protein